MATSGGPGHDEGPGGQRPPDWSRSDAVLQAEIQREAHQIKTNRTLVVMAFVLFGIAIVAVALSILALSRDIESAAKAAPKDDSVGTPALQTASVTAEKLAAGAVGTDALKDGAVVRAKIAERAVDGSRVAPDSLTGGQIAEGSLGVVPRAAKSDTATNATSLGGVAASKYLSDVQIVRRGSNRTFDQLKGPVVATCPAGTGVIGGGASVEGTRGVAIVESGPESPTRWSAIAEAAEPTANPWRLVVTVICAKGAGAG